MKLTKNTKDYLIIILTSILVTVVYFSPFLLNAFRGYKPELRFLGDLQLAGYPAFIQTGKYFSDWIYSGIDLFTANGSSSLFNRPNFTSYYLPQLLLQSIIHVSDNTHAAKLFTVQMWLSGFISMLFTALWLSKIIKINIYPSLLGGALFFSIVGYSYSQIAFFNVACMFPAVIYCLSISLAIRTDIYQKVLLALPLVVILTAGYLPIAVMGICVAIIASLVLSKSMDVDEPKYKDFVVVLAIGGLVISGYLLTIIKATQLVSAVPKIPLIETVFFADIALTFKGVIHLFLASALNDSGEGPHIRLGLPILVLLYVSYSHLTANGNSWKKNTFNLCMLLFLLSILLGMGRYSGFADVFFYSVPGLGGMHIYARYMLISVFFLVFGLITALSDIYSTEKQLNLKIPAIGIAITCVLIILFPDILIKNNISLPVLFVELLISVLVLFALNLRGDNKFALLLIPILVFHQGSFAYMNINWITLANTGNTAIDIVNSESRTNGLIDYFYTNTNKSLVKYIDLTPEIEKPGGVPHNFPWFIRYQKNDTRRISSYMGYEQALSQQLEYAQRFSYFGKYDKNYLIESGVDYVLYDQKSKAKESEWLTSIVDNKIPEYDIGNGYFAAKVLQKNGADKSPVFDNGIFKVYSDAPDFEVNLFRTNWSSKIELNLKSSQGGVLNFQLFPHKYWEYQLNGSTISPTISQTGLASFILPTGTNRFTVSYSNSSNVFFVYTYFTYIFLIILILMRYIFKKWPLKFRSSGVAIQP